ncbi:MAG: carbohydrate-binding domain-containing protein [Alistipes sp.]|nr:carbohydrate-binding domain-containing protein [Alistipes sp.]
MKFIIKGVILSLLAVALFACTDNSEPELPSSPDVPSMGDQSGDEEGSEDASNGEDTEGDQNTGGADNNTGANDVENYTPEIPIEENGYDGLLATDKALDVVVSGDATYWENTDFGSTVTIVYSKNSAEVTTANSAIKYYITGADVALELSDCSAVEVIAKGATEDGQLKIYGNAAVKLTLEGLYIKSAKSAAINVQNSSTLYLHLADGAENYICDAPTQSDEAYYPEGVVSSDEKRNGALYCKGSVVVSGSGLLVLDGEKKHGISVKKALTVRAGVTMAVNDVADNCFKAEGITLLGGYIWAKTSAEAGKCLSSDADITVKGGLLKLYTTGGSIYEEDENDTSSPAGMKADGNMVITAGDILCVSTGEGGKGLNVDGNLTIDGGTINVVTSGGKYVYNAALDLDSSPKGVKADGEIAINGGLLNIQVTGKSDGSEGLESKSKITINDGEVFVYAYDDAINVGGDSPTGMEVNGGRVFAFADNNDGIDSNGKLWINGGLVIASGSAAPEEGFDCDNSQNFIVTGGTLIGTGGAAISTSSSSTQLAVIYNGVSAKTGELFVITDAEGNPILKYELPRTMSSMSLFFSSPDIKSGATYTVYSGGSLSGNTVNWNGWFEDGLYTTGTQLGTFTASGTTTTVGQSNGPGGGPGNGGGGFGPGWWN